MELYFCSKCGISIPQREVEEEGAAAGDGKYLCREHRELSEDSLPASPASADASPADALAAAGENAGDVELLFCANCRISIPQSDVRAGRARKEYGSLLCSVCTRADPGERASRRESVEAEMAADADETDNVHLRRCSVCAAMVPESHLVTGRAEVNGDRVVCAACTAVGAAESSGSRGLLLWVGLPLLAAGAFGVGFLAMTQFGEKDDQRMADALGRIEALEREKARLNSRIATMEKADQARAAKAPGWDAALEEIQERWRGELQNLRTDLVKTRAESDASDKDTDERLAKQEGRLNSLAELVKALAQRPDRVIEVKKTDPGGDDPDPQPPVKPENGGGDGPDKAAENPLTTQLVKQLLDSKDNGDRFSAATELGKLGDERAIPHLAQGLVGDKNYLVRRACARSLGALKAWYAVPALITALEEKEPFVAQRANDALGQIADQDFGVTQDQNRNERRKKAKAARKWWDENRESPPAGVSTHPAELRK